jgi:hypothetical protein
MEGLKIGYQLLFSDGGKVNYLRVYIEVNLLSTGEQTRAPLQRTEYTSPPTQSVLNLLKLPKLIKYFLSLVLRSRLLSYIFGFGSQPDPLSAELYTILHKKTVMEERRLVEERDNYRAEWHKKLTEEGVDFVLTVPHALPALENGGSERTTLMSAGYTFIFSLVSDWN